MEKKDIDWSNLGFGYVKTDKRFVSNYKDGSWDEGVLTEDDKVVISECAGVLQYAQTCFEGLKAYTTEDGHIVMFRPDLNAKRLADSAARLEMPVFPEDTHHACADLHGLIKACAVKKAVQHGDEGGVGRGKIHRTNNLNL